MKTDTWLIYGAYGYTGALIAREAVRRGWRPTLAGRREQPLAALAQELELPWRILNLEDGDTLAKSVSEFPVVLHCAGPFVHTSRPLVDACLQSGCHYLDITGEIGVFESIFRRDSKARDAGVVLLPGVGLDVVPTDCLAAHLSSQLPDATHLELALHSEKGGASRGTLSTMIEGIPHLGAERIDGTIVPRPPAFDTREIEFSHGPRWTMTIPWGDLATAYRTTGIPNIRVYMGSSQRQIARLRRITPLLPLLGTKPIKRTLQWWIRRSVTGPPKEVRDTARSYFWGSVRTGNGDTLTATMEAPEGYRLTALTAIECVERILAGGAQPGAWTPAGLFGPDLVRSIDGVSVSW